MFNQNKKKINSRVRFQNASFKQRLQAHRGYKRQSRALPDTDWAVFLSKIGLGTWLARILTLLVLFLLIYIVYIPNFLFIKQINITGVSGNELVSVQNSVNAYLGKTLPWPQKNLILLSKPKLSEFLLSNNKKILKIDSVNKKLPATLNITIEPRLDLLSLQTPLATYSVSNDGLVTNELIANASGTLPTLPILIKLNSAESIIVGHTILPQSKIDFINSINGRLPSIVKSSIIDFQISDLETPDLTVNFQNNFRVIFDSSLDLNKTLSRLALLTSQYADADFKKLDYIDMRFEGRGYVCSKGNPCIKDISLPNNASTTQPSITN